MNIEEYKKALKCAEDKQFEHECADDMYYSSYQYEKDKQIIEELKAKVKELENA